jgi:hypothetical protein
MIIQKCANKEGKGELIIIGSDRVGRADARLVSLITKTNREIKTGVESTYHYEDVYKQSTSVMTFNWEDRNKVSEIVRRGSFAVTMNE